MRKKLLILAGLVAVSAVVAVAQGRYHVAQRVALGGEGGWDYLTFDREAQRLFITRATHVIVIDARTLKATGEIPDTPGVHGVALAPLLDRGFISDGGDSTVTIFHLKTLKVLDRVKVGDRPDAILYDPYSKHVFTFNARGHDTTVLDAATGKILGSISLGGKPEFAATDGKGSVWVNIEDTSELAKIDVSGMRVSSRSPLTGCENPSALAFDPQHRRLFSGCENSMMTVVDADNGKLITTVPIGRGVDAGAFDQGTQQVFMSCGEGILKVIHEDTPDRYSVTETVTTARGARTMTLDPDSGTVYTVTAQFGEAPAGHRPPIKPGTFELLVLKRQ